MSSNTFSCIMSHSQVFVDDEYLPYICALEFSTKHLLLHVPVTNVGHDDIVAKLKSAQSFRILIQGHVDDKLVAVVDQTLRGFRFDRLNYSVKIHNDGSYWIAELRFVAPMTAVDGDTNTAD